MHYEALGNLGDFVGGIAVIITLIYLAVQMRLNTRAIQHSNTRQSAAAQATLLQAVAENEDLASLILKGLESTSELNNVERYRFDLGLTIWLQAYEQAFADHRDGIFPDENLQPYIDTIAGFLGTPGGSAYWKERKTWFSGSFRKEVESILSSPSAESMNSGPIIRPGK